MSKAWRRSALAAVLIAGLPDKTSAQSLAPTEGARTSTPTTVALPPTNESPKAQPLPSIQVSAKRAKPRTKPAPTPAPPQTTSPAPSTASSGVPNVAAGAANQPSLASQTAATGEDLNARPVTRPGEILEAAPGLIVTQHSGEGKANQYFLRGYNLDHGTDMAITVDDMPINLRTHAHGQGYSDLNWLMPETVNGMDIRKGPYFADLGDFGSAGALDIHLIDTIDKKIAELTVGSFGYERLFGMGAAKTDPGGTLLFAGEVGAYKGPWANPDDVQKINGMMRYSQGTATDGFSMTAMGYSNKWNSTDQVPERAITSAQIGLYGEEDPTDGGNSSRFSLSARVAQTDAAGSWKANLYFIHSTLDLFNNFTYFLTNPLQGDQFHQHDDRFLTGGNASRTLNGSFAARPVETTFGVQIRDDAIDLGLTDTYQRVFLSNIRSDRVNEGSAGIYAESTVHWTDWYRTTFGWRGDYYAATVDSLFDASNSGRTQAAIGSPKFRMVLGPFNKTEFFFGAGMGFHSNDVRGVTITEEPVDRIASPGAASTPLGAAPFLVRTRGAEVGVRTKAIQGLDSSVSLFLLDQASEIIFNGDGGDTSPSRPSERYGVEWTNRYRPLSWVDIDADLAMTHARFIGYDAGQEAAYLSLAGYPQAQIGNGPGNFIPNAPAVVASAGITLGEKTGWFGTLRWRYLGPSPLTEDNAFRSPPTSIFNGRIGYQFDNGWRIQLDVLNLLNSRANQITYAYGSLIKSDALFAMCFPASGPPTAPAAVCQNGVMDYVLHPVEPLAVRVSLTGTF
jgi:outer membrane receptor protein involved in Fe transport